MSEVVIIRIVNRDNPRQFTEFDCPKSFYLTLKSMAKDEHISLGKLFEKMILLYDKEENK